jgi:hypothetical protein
MYFTNQLPALSGVRRLENLQIWLGQRALNETEDQWIVVDGDKLDGRRSTYGSEHCIFRWPEVR